MWLPRLWLWLSWQPSSTSRRATAPTSGISSEASTWDADATEVRSHRARPGSAIWLASGPGVLRCPRNLLRLMAAIRATLSAAVNAGFVLTHSRRFGIDPPPPLRPLVTGLP